MVEFVDIGASSKRLIEAGIPETHAESIVQVIADTLNQVSDRLVSRDYLDMRLLEQQSYIDSRFAEERAHMDERFSKVEERFTEIDHRFSSVDKRFSGIDQRFTELESRLVQMKAESDMGLIRLDHKINYLFLMVGLIFTVQIIPVLKAFFAG